MNGPDHLLERAFTLDRDGHPEAAAAAYAAFLDRNPFHPTAWANLGGVRFLLGDLDGAERACRKALALAPGLASARINLAHILLARDRVEEAEAHCQGVLAQEPHHLGALIALSDLQVKRGAFEAARATLHRARELGPEAPAVSERLHNLDFHVGDWPSLRRTAERAIAALPPDTAAYELSLWQLLFGEFQEGWRNYEARLRVPDMKLVDVTLSGPRWDGRPFPGKTLLLYWEQGFGDTLMCLRYLPLVKALGGRVLLVVQEPLRALAATVAGVDALLRHGDPLPPYDLHAFLFSLPGLFNTDLDRIPDRIPYLDVPPEVPHREALTQAFAQAGPRPRIGLVWGGNPTHWRNEKRSIPGPLWAPLATLPDVAWYSLQLDRTDVPELPGLTDLRPLLGSFSDTAFALRQLDLLISIDSGVAHLAGALGVPTFLLLNFHPDFRWLLARADTPWYPRTRLYREPMPGRWDAVIQAIQADLGGEAAPE